MAKRERDTEGSRRTFWLSLAVVLATSLILPMVSAGWGELFNETDGQYAAAARAIVEGRSEWWIPENNGVPRLNKPPLLVWFTAASFSAFGVNEFAARFPVALGVAAWVVMTFFLGAAILGTRTGMVGALVLLTFLGTSTLGRIVMPESWFCAFFCLSIYCGWKEMERRYSGEKKSFLLLYGFWIGVALACFVKGWHGLVLAPAVLAGTAIFRRELLVPLVRLLLFWPGMLVLFFVNAPWFLAVDQEFPGFLRSFLFDEMVGHVVGSDRPATDYTNVGRVPFFLLHLVWFFPWVLLVFPLLWRRESWKLPSGPEWLLVSWGLVVLGILLVVGQRQDYYGMMGWPVAALLFARCWQNGFWKHLGWGLAGIGVFGLCATASFALWQDWLPAESAGMADRATALETLGGFDAGVWRELAVISWSVFAGLLLGGVLAEVVSKRWKENAGTPVFLCWMLAAITLFFGAGAGVATLAPWFSHKEIAGWILANRPQFSNVVFEGGSDTGSSLYFYLGRDIGLVGPSATPEFAAAVHGRGKQRYLEYDDVIGQLNGSVPLLIVTEKKEVPLWKIRHPGLKEIFHAGTQVILE